MQEATNLSNKWQQIKNLGLSYQSDQKANYKPVQTELFLMISETFKQF